MRLISVSLLVVLVAVGCAVPPTTSVETNPAQEYFVQNEILVDRPFEEVWDGLVAQLAKSFFVINNIAKDSRLINLSFSIDTPESYIDCGSTSRTYEKTGVSEVFEYSIAEDSSFKWAKKLDASTHADYLIDRDTKLEGRINVYVAPEGDGTRVSINTRYMFNILVTGRYIAYNAFGTAASSGAIDPQRYDLSFNTMDSGSTTITTAGTSTKIACNCTGDLERTILELVEADSE